MATIRPNDHAPAEDVRYTFPTADIDLGPGGSYETDERDVLSAADVHPWLTVEYPVLDEADIPHRDPFVPFDEDPLGGLNANVPFDLDEVIKAEAAKLDEYQPLAVAPQLDQSEPVVEGGIARTIAAADEAPTSSSSSWGSPTDDKAVDDGQEG